VMIIGRLCRVSCRCPTFRNKDTRTLISHLNYQTEAVTYANTSASVATESVTYSGNFTEISEKKPIHTDAVSYSDRSHASVKRTIEQLLDKGEVPMFDVNVGDIISSKADKRVATIFPDSTVFDAIKVMSEQKVGALLVIDANNKPIGVFSERDYMNKIALKGLSSKTTLVQDVMTKDIFTTKPNVSAAKCMSHMTKGRFRRMLDIPVVDNSGTLLGIVSIGDLVKHVLDQQKVTIEHLKEYIMRTY